MITGSVRKGIILPGQAVRNVILSPELIIDGTFQFGISNWTSDKIITWTDNTLKCVGSFGTGETFYDPTIPLVFQDKCFRLEFDLLFAPTGQFEVNMAGHTLISLSTGSINTGHYSVDLATPGLDNGLLHFTHGGQSYSMTLDNVSLKEIICS